MVSRFSFLRRSGVKPGTSDQGAPWLPPGGVTPPRIAEVRHVCGAIVLLPPKGNVLARHIVEGFTPVPRLKADRQDFP